MRRAWPDVSCSRSDVASSCRSVTRRFDALSFTYLLRYVPDPAAALAELVRVVRPGGVMANLEFLVPASAFWRMWWWLYTRLVLPVAGYVTGGSEWFRVGRVPGPEHLGPLPALSDPVDGRRMGARRDGRRGGAADEPRWRAGDVGPQSGHRGEAAMAEAPARPAFYAARRGGWRDWWTLLHPPYTAWHLSYVVIGACLAPRVSVSRLVATLLAFFLAVGVAAHALDELHGRPLRTRIPSAPLVAATVVGLAGAVFLGIAGRRPGGMGAGAVHRGRTGAGRRLQRRALRRDRSHRPRVRPGLGRVPGAHRLRGAGGDAAAGGRARRARRDGVVRRSAQPQHPGAHAAPAGGGRGGHA